MNQLYHWLGFTLFWLLVAAGSWAILWVLWTVFAGLWRRLLREWDWLNYRWFYAVDLMEWYLTGRSHKMNPDRVRRVEQAFQKEPHRTKLKQAAPFRRDFVALMARHYRRLA